MEHIEVHSGRLGPLEDGDVVVDAVIRIRDHQGRVLANKLSAFSLHGVIGVNKIKPGLLSRLEEGFRDSIAYPFELTAAEFVREQLRFAQIHLPVNPSFQAAESWGTHEVEPDARDPVQRPGSYAPDNGRSSGRLNIDEISAHRRPGSYRTAGNGLLNPS